MVIISWDVSTITLPLYTLISIMRSFANFVFLLKFLNRQLPLWNANCCFTLLFVALKNNNNSYKLLFRIICNNNSTCSPDKTDDLFQAFFLSSTDENHRKWALCPARESRSFSSEGSRIVMTIIHFQKTLKIYRI